jgi:hypothetical protein
VSSLIKRVFPTLSEVPSTLSSGTGHFKFPTLRALAFPYLQTPSAYPHFKSNLLYLLEY